MIAGVGPGLGASLSRRFAKEYTVVLLARSQGTLNTVSETIRKDGGEVILLMKVFDVQSPSDFLPIAAMKLV